MKDLVKKHSRSKAVDALLLLVALLFLSLFLALPGSAADLRAENLELCKRRAAELEQQLEEFKALDDSVGGSLSQSVISSVNRYRKQLLDLQSHSEIALRSLKKEIELAFLRGSTAGRLTWIYATNAATAQNETESRSFLMAYEALMQELDATETLTAASPLSFSRDLNVAIYSERVRSLAEADDSLRTSAILAGAVEEIRGLLSGELAGEPYREILERAKAEAGLQRHRDALYADFLIFYRSIRSGASAESDEITSLLLYRLTQSKSLADMNSAVRSASFGLLDRFADHTHKRAYITSVKEQIDREIASAQGAGRRACVSAHVSDFTLRYQRADTKDRVEQAAASSPYAPSDELTRLISEYIAAGGILEGCATESELSFELWRAKLRIGWWETLCATKKEISSLLTPHDATAMRSRAEAEWSAIDARICAISRNTAAAEADCTQALNNGRSALSALLPEAEAEKFSLDHIGIIEKAQGTLVTDDRDVMIIAIQDWQKLSAEAKNHLSAEAGKLRESYRAVTRLCLLKTMREDKASSLRKSFINKLCETLLTLNLTELTELGAAADGLLLQGETLSLLLDRYHEILSDVDYIKYDEKYRTDLDTLCESACRSILSLSVLGYEPSPKLTALLEQGILSLIKTQAIASIHLAAEDSTLPEVTSALRIAEARIEAATSEQGIAAVAEEGILTIRKAILEEQASKLSSDVIQRLSALSYLTEEQRQTLVSEITQKAQEIAAKIPIAADLAELNLAYTAYTISCEGILAKGEALHLSKCKEEAASELLAMIAKGKEDLSALPEPEEEIKLQFSEQLSALEAKIMAEIHLAEEQKRVDTLLSEAEGQIRTIVTDARLYKIRLLREELLNGLEARFGISHYYSEEQYKSIRLLIEAFRAELEARETSEEYESLLKNTTTALLAVPTLLDEAKQSSRLLLKETYNALLADAAAYSEKNLALLADLVTKATADMEAITSISDHQSVLLICNEANLAMKSVPKDRLYNGPASITGTVYPNGFSPDADGLWGVITAPNAIPSDSRLSISLRPFNTDDYYKLIQSAIDQKTLFTAKGDAVSLSLRRQLKRAELLLCADIRAALPTQDGGYRVELLLPEGYDADRLLGVVWFGTDGSAEYYNAELSNSVISFETNHFSSFYIVTKSKTNLLPLILLISFLILAELVLLAILLYRRKKRSDEEDPSLPPALPFAGYVAPLSIFGGSPKSDWPLVACLSGIALLLGLANFYLLREELALLRAQKPQDTHHRDSSPPKLSYSRRMALSTAKSLVAVSSAKGDHTEALEPLASLSETEEEETAAEESDPTAEIRAELKLDTLSRHFREGDCVTPELLKQMGLIPEDTTHLKILTGGHLTFPLFISAQEFSNAALRAIKKAGGKAFRIQ